MLMPSWVIKSVVQRAISWLPNRQFWNRLLQTYITKSTRLSPEAFETKVKECHRHLQAFSSFHSNAADFTVLELGTGWSPIIPIGLYLCGAKKIWTIDIQPLLRPAALRRVLEYYYEYAQGGELDKMLPGIRPERAQKVWSLLPRASEAPARVLAQLEITVHVGDARTMPIPDGQIDFFTSSAVLEYIPRPVLQGILSEARRLAAPGAVMSHRLNLADEYSYFDRSITPFNFLRYTEKQWRWRNSPLIWQNRLRVSDYRPLFAEAGFELLREENISGSAEDLARVKLAPEFEHYTREDLLVLHSFLIARLRGRSDSGPDNRHPSGAAKARKR